MDEASRLNATLERDHPVVARCLSPLGRRAVFPKGIPYQAAAARDTEINATIGQLTDGRGAPMPLPAMASRVVGLDPVQTFLYAPVDGPPALRRAWIARQRRLAGDPSVEIGTPVVTHGLTHAISLVADLFADDDTEVIVPLPAWENYDLLFGLHAGARISGFPFFRDERFNVESLADTLAKVRHKAIIVLNFPGNPTGYTPSAEEAAQIVEVLTSWRGPGVVVLDDAYQGWVYEPGLMRRSLFWDLVERADPERLLPLKVDGATKELLFFSSRVGFLTPARASEAAEQALLSKIKCVIRGTVGCASGPAMAMVAQALQDPDLDSAFEARRRELDGRYRALKAGLQELAERSQGRLVPSPFNSAFFALVGLRGGLDAQTLRQRLITEQSVGTIAFPEENALRIAYCSIHERALPELVDRLSRVL